jgi:hypothetical protein
LLRVVDLAQIQNGALHTAPVTQPPIFYDAEVAMLFTVFPSFVGPQKHGGAKSAKSSQGGKGEGGRSPPQRHRDNLRCNR